MSTRCRPLSHTYVHKMDPYKGASSSLTRDSSYVNSLQANQPVIPTCLPSFMHPSILVRVTQTCMPDCNVWAEVVYCGFAKSKVFTKTLICLFPACHQSLYLYQVSYVGVLWLVRFANLTRRRKRR